ncbi:MAG: hypothetical protein GY796_36705 [Chloroflexi bacterium]|nr:hypothetical protein [Chloroflexota bacterium]
MNQSGQVKNERSLNFGDAGTHFKQATPFFQVPLQTRRRDFRLRPVADAIAVYDSLDSPFPI